MTLKNLCEVRLANGLIIQLPLSSINELREIYLWKIYESVNRVEEGDIVVDVGAEVGSFTLKAAIQGASTVLAFEPYSPNFQCLLGNIERNRWLFRESKIMSFETALADKEGTATLWLHEQSGSNSLVAIERNDQHTKVAIHTLDAALERAGVKHVDFIKIDVEGAAHIVLRGASKALEERPNLAIAVYHWEREAEEIRKMLKIRNYKVEEFNTTGQHVEEGGAFIHAWR